MGSTGGEIRCSGCDAVAGRESEFCPRCGHLFVQTPGLACENHRTEQAIGVCIICWEPVCERCADRSGGRVLCVKHRRLEVQQDWVVVYESDDVNTAEVVRGLLESLDFNVVVRNFGSRVEPVEPAKVFVPIPEFFRAVDALREGAPFAGGEAGERF